MDPFELRLVLELVFPGLASLCEAERETVIHRMLAQIADGQFPNDYDPDGGDPAFVRDLDPKGPAGVAGMAVRPESDLGSIEVDAQWRGCG